jgi:glutamate-1-semialdehyde 2,1-aminomutase
MASGTAVLPLNDETLLKDFFENHGKKLAAAVIEGIPANNGLLIQFPEYVNKLRSLTEKYGALLVFDEVITGFRLGLGGAAAWYGVVPDIVTFGKVIGGGMPVGAFGGRTGIMDRLSPTGPVYQAGTLSGNPIAMAAGLTTLKKLADGRIYADLESKTTRFVQTLKSNLTGIDVVIPHIASIFWIVFQKNIPRSASEIDPHGIARFNRMHGAALDAGIYLPPSGYEVCFISAAHTEDMLMEAADVLSGIIRKVSEP